jgi:DNA modification methylase
MTGWKVITGDSLTVMRSMPAGAVDAIVTSPPYADQRAYDDGELGGRRGNSPANARIRARSRKARSTAPALWAEWLEPYTAEMLRVLKPTGSLMLNVGVVMRDGEEHDCTDAILRNCRAQGWKVLHRLVWHKPNGQVPSAPGYLTISHEFVLWLASSTTTVWRAFEQPPGSQASREVRTPHKPSSVVRSAGIYTGTGAHRKQSNDLDPGCFRTRHKLHPDGARPTTVIVCSVGGQANPNGHPARMPLKFAAHLVSMCCPPSAS